MKDKLIFVYLSYTEEMDWEAIKSEWVPDVENIPWDQYDDSDEKAIPCTKCLGRGEGKIPPKLKDLRLPRRCRKAVEKARKKAKVCFILCQLF